MKVTIHQPDLMPWLGFFVKIAKTDLWVVLDHTKNNPRDASFWGRRVRVLVNGNPHWLSLPLVKPKNGNIGQQINEMEYNDSNPKIFIDALKTVELSYRSTPFFEDIFPLVEDFLLDSDYILLSRNMKFILSTMQLLDIKCKILYSSTLDCRDTSTAMLAEILQKVGATTYICGDGAHGYQVDSFILKRGFQIQYNNYSNPNYLQKGTRNFVPGLSVIDALMNIGIEATRKIIFNE